MKKQPKRITSAERDAAKKAARTKIQALIESGQMTPHEAAFRTLEACQSDQAERACAQALLATFGAEETAEMEAAMSELREHNLHGAPVPRWTAEFREKVARFANARMILKVIGG